MYRIKDDKRCQKSARMIKDGLIACLKTKKMNEVTVSDIASASKVSRATFYRLFDTPVDVLGLVCEEFSSAFSKEFMLVKDSPQDEVSYRFLSFWMDNASIIEAVMRSGRHDIMQDAFQDKNISFLPSWAEGEFSAAEEAYVNASSIAILSSILLVWIKYGKKETPEQLFDLFRRISSR